jgi:hypothetical protein
LLLTASHAAIAAQSADTAVDEILPEIVAEGATLKPRESRPAKPKRSPRTRK